MNSLKTGLLLVALTVILVAIGHLVGGVQGATVAFGFALVMNIISYWFSDKMVLAMYRAKPLSESEGPQVYRAVRDIALKTGMPMPKLYWIATSSQRVCHGSQSEARRGRGHIRTAGNYG